MLEIKQKPRLHATWIDREAIDIVQRLQKAGYKCYLVGGCVRDLLAGIIPKDYDIVTDANPNEVKRKVWGSYIIGRRFRLVLAKRGDQQYEISTFRRASRPEDFVEGEDAPIGDNFFGTPEEDAIRRDFTVNALFYDPVKDELIDYAKGMADIEQRVIRMIGDPKTRILEDSIRSLRAVRLAHKLHFSIAEEFRSAIQETAADVAKSVLPRRREEYLKFLRLPDPVPALCELYDLDLMRHLLPTLHEMFSNAEVRDQFLTYLQTGMDLIQDSKNPVDLYLPVLLAFQHAYPDKETFEHAQDQLMRVELGMFKAESVEVLEIIALSTSLPPVESFKKRGFRRQSAFLRQPRLHMALGIAQREFLLTASDLAFWLQALSSAPASSPAPQASEDPA